MDFIISLLTDPKVLSLLSLPVICMMVEAWVIFSLYKKVDSLQEKRLEEAKHMNEDWIQLSTDVNKTLDLIVKLSGKKNNGGTN